jgi:hypothetical protein
LADCWGCTRGMRTQAPDGEDCLATRHCAMVGAEPEAGRCTAFPGGDHPRGMVVRRRRPGGEPGTTPATPCGDYTASHRDRPLVIHRLPTLAVLGDALAGTTSPSSITALKDARSGKLMLEVCKSLNSPWLSASGSLISSNSTGNPTNSRPSRPPAGGFRKLCDESSGLLA